jgi:hypothetical protein
MDQAAKEPARVALDGPLLPWLQRDLALVLHTATVLRKHVRPVL